MFASLKNVESPVKMELIQVVLVAKITACDVGFKLNSYTCFATVCYIPIQKPVVVVKVDMVKLWIKDCFCLLYIYGNANLNLHDNAAKYPKRPQMVFLLRFEQNGIIFDCMINLVCYIPKLTLIFQKTHCQNIEIQPNDFRVKNQIKKFLESKPVDFIQEGLSKKLLSFDQKKDLLKEEAAWGPE
ncbi:hypothetical protein BpHYR1_027162 [Brachionus plicatilis]|uniref:Uncharacterized protein n=1 Tax=Brachionus plicatilis TaxID=10195 RepID=A0A3M7QFB6_BRAPC|nr:hypothetical protein BpHYR1_027162 [Brachionus plicatilis]